MKIKPVTMAGYRSVKQRIWEYLRGMRCNFSVPELVDASGVGYGVVKDYVDVLIRGGIVAEISPPSGCCAARLRLANDVGVEAPRLKKCGAAAEYGNAQQRIWDVLRIGGLLYDPRELALTARAEYPLTRAYIRYLHAAGYLDMVTAPVGNRPGRYRLFPGKHTGPRAPVVRVARCVFDPNLDRDVWVASVKDADVEGAEG